MTKRLSLPGCAFLLPLSLALALGSHVTSQAPTEFKLTASDAAAFDQFGFSVALSGDTALVGAHFDDATATDSGSAYVYELVRDPVYWSTDSRRARRALQHGWMW